MITYLSEFEPFISLGLEDCFLLFMCVCVCAEGLVANEGY